MSKNGNRVKWISLGVSVLVLIVGVVLAWGDLGKADALQSERTTSISLKTDILKDDGCKPSQKNKFDIALVQKDIETIQTAQKAILDDTQEILRRLPAK